jgi:hypothetical protein
VLVVGSETISTQVQQQMVDDLYLQENILLMTYPMLVEQLKTKITTKNMLKVGPKGVDALTIGAPDQLLSKGPDVGLPRLPDNDPFGIKMAGLGRALHASRSARSVGHPESFKRVFYRSEGRCEHAGCLDQVIQNGVFSGHLAHIYNNIGNDSKPETYSHIEFVGLFCSEHVKNLNNGHRYTLGQYHPLNVALAQRKAYRPALDAAASICSDSWPSNASKQILEVLCIDADLEPQLAQDVHQWSTAVISLPDSCQWLLHRIVREYFTPPCSRSRLDWNRIDYLRRAGVISVTAVDPTTNLVAPKVFSQPFIDRVRNTFRDRTPLAIEALCRANAYTLSQQLEYLAVDEAGASLC